ncbi:ABC transporter permease [Afifella sp. IM 167]|uniref:ABC transporter permease n=1 Tax=Afifella sp. IM 167 TaxID=2033586 RepID=UPI001CCF1CEE|nr:ABC transporter permease [Afifella sp. IM 167]MBZ8131881.1 polyamine ABC transporter permease [Afifella sp. IM 167]
MGALATARSARPAETSSLWLALPAILALGLFFFAPLANLVTISFSGETAFSAYERFFASPAATRILVNTVLVALAVSASCTLMALAFALAIRTLTPFWARLALLSVTLPLWISILVRSYSWLYVLAQEGIVNRSLLALGLTDQPFQLLFNWGAVGLGIGHILLPYALLPIHNAVEALDPLLLRAARSLGAGPARIFFTLILPLTARGILTGAALVFVLALGFYVTPQMLGSARNTMLAVYVDVLVNTMLDWPRAAAASLVLVVTVAAGIALLAFAAGRTVARLRP